MAIEVDRKIQEVWEKGQIVENIDAMKWRRKDACGAWINRNLYGDHDSLYGWEIDHIDPDGSDDINNLQPLQWENNVVKSDGSLKCIVIAVGQVNIRVE